MIEFLNAKATSYKITISWIAQELNDLHSERPKHDELINRLQIKLNECEALRNQLEIIIRVAIQGMDTVRKQTRSHLTARQVRTLKRDRYILFHRKNELDEKDKFILATWIGQFPSLGKAYQLKEEFCDLWLIKDKQEAQERYLKWMMDVPTELEPAFQPLISAMTNWKPEILSYWDYPVTNAYTEALAGLVKLANRIGRGYSFQAIRAKILYSGLPTVHKPVFNRVLEERLPFRPMAAIPEVKNYGIPFSTLYELWEKGMDCEW